MARTGRIVIPIKQVPETSDVKMDEKTGTMVREGAPSIVNPLDLYAIEAGIQLKERWGGTVTVISMGPGSADKSLREALAMGCDDAVLVTGSEFAGSDTRATSLALSKAIGRIGAFDLVITGERATDGETGHVGPGIASFLDLPLSTYTSRIVLIEEGQAPGNGPDADKDHVVVERMVEGGYETLRLALPALLTVTKEISRPRLPTLRGKQRARITRIPVWSMRTLDLEESDVGLKGSPTRVVKLRAPKVSREGTVFRAHDEESAERAVDMLVTFMEEKHISQ
jgi:electron transfer flavoprotein beta subunit